LTIISISAFIITLRETMEAALIIGILLAYLSKTGNNKLKKDVWIGTSIAVLFSIIGAIVFESLIGGFEGDTEIIFEGVVMILAASVLSWMIIWMYTNSKTIKLELEKKSKQALSENNKYAFVSIAFIAVFREGIETALFVLGISTNETGSEILLGSLFGIITASIFAALLFRGAIELDIKKFFNTTSVILIVFASGLFSSGIHEFQELGLFGSESSFLNEHLWDSSSFLNDKDGGLGSLIRSLFGYQDKPSPLELIAYLFYWIFVLLAFKKINNQFKTNISYVAS